MVLKAIEYAGYDDEPGAGDRSPSHARVFCYVVRPADTSGTEWEWAVWSITFPFRRFALCRDGAEGYLAWNCCNELWFAELAEARTADASLALDLGRVPPGVIRVPVQKAAGEAAFPGLDDFAANITPVSVRRDEAGRYVVQAAGTGGKVFTFVGDGTTWRVK